MTKLRIVCIFLVCSAVPLLLSLAAIFLWPGKHGSDYWAAAPWLVLPALWVTPFWIIVVTIGLTFFVHKKGVRPSTLKYENAAIFAVVAVVVGIPVGWYEYKLWKVKRSLDAANADEVLGYWHLKSSDQISRLYKGPYHVKADRRERGPDERGVRRLGYIVSAKEDGVNVRYFAVVDVLPSGSGRQAQLVCMRPVDFWVNTSPSWDSECDESR
jgi:hypothetical protein